jgi:hypothetical protein
MIKNAIRLLASTNSSSSLIPCRTIRKETSLAASLHRLGIVVDPRRSFGNRQVGVLSSKAFLPSLQTPKCLLVLWVRHPNAFALAQPHQTETRSRLDSTRVCSLCAPAALAAGEAVDDDGEEGNDGVDDSLNTRGDGVNNRHDAVADGAEDRLDLKGC